MEDKSAHIRVIRILSFVDGSVVLCLRLPGFPIGAPEFYIFDVILLGERWTSKDFQKA
jgi:hypothetical protein